MYPNENLDLKSKLSFLGGHNVRSGDHRTGRDLVERNVRLDTDPRPIIAHALLTTSMTCKGNQAGGARDRLPGSEMSIHTAKDYTKED